jgi:hypothetical protein
VVLAGVEIPAETGSSTIGSKPNSRQAFVQRLYSVVDAGLVLTTWKRIVNVFRPIRFLKCIQHFPNVLGLAIYFAIELSQKVNSHLSESQCGFVLTSSV